MKEISKRMKTIAAILGVGGVLGFLLLLIVYTLPASRMVYNASASIELFEELGCNPQIIKGYESTTIDTYTDAWMMRIAFYDGKESALQKSLNNYSFGYDGGQTGNVCESMIAYLKGLDGYKRFSYGRYWHGYLIILKPLLCFFDYSDIMGILKFVQIALAAGCIVLMERRKIAKCIPCLIVMLGCVEFHMIGMSMQFSWVFIIAMICSICLLRIDENKIYDVTVDLTFLLAGMCTSYFDFLTYPLFTLGIPLTFIFLRRNVSEQKGRLFFTSLLNSFYWLVGYGGMWFIKWVLCTVFTDENVIADGFSAIMSRSGSDVMGEKVGYWDVLEKNMWIIGKYPYALAVICAVILLLVGKGQFVKVSKDMLAAGLFIACLPLLWYAISRNHSYIHSFMTYRNLSISVFAVLCFLAQIKKPLERDKDML